MLPTELQNVLNRKGDRTMNGKEAITCRRRNGSSVNLFFISIIVVLLLIGQPVGAFTAPRSTIGLGLYRRSVQNQNSTTSHKIGENEENGLEQKTHASAVHKVFVSPLQEARSWNNKVRTAYRKRTNADPSFFAKSVTEVLVAAGTQLMAEWNRRGASRMVSELDFVVPAVLTAVFGKYYSMWRTAKTLDDDVSEDNTTSSEAGQSDRGDPIIFGLSVPTNAFQPKMADGVTTPTTQQRLGSFLAPVHALFKAGTIASCVGYGITTILIGLRTLLIPSYQTETIPVNVLYASIYTGCFMAVVSNLRYQILQGLVEPILIDKWIFFGINDEKLQNSKLRRFLVLSRSLLIFMVRWLNGLLGSVLAITGMRMCGLQRLKS